MMSARLPGALLARRPTPCARVALLLWILRGCYIVLILGVALITLDHYSGTLEFTRGYISSGLIVVVGVAVLLADIKLKHKDITTISAVFFGLLLGLLLGTLFSAAL